MYLVFVERNVLQSFGLKWVHDLEKYRECRVVPPSIAVRVWVYENDL